MYNNDNKGVTTKEKWDMNDLLVKASMLHLMNNNTIPPFEDK